ncbi:unnamed protein product [Diplocarpon coronariae]
MHVGRLRYSLNLPPPTSNPAIPSSIMAINTNTNTTTTTITAPATPS